MDNKVVLDAILESDQTAVAKQTELQVAVDKLAAQLTQSEAERTVDL